MTTSASGANNTDQQQQQDQGWRLPQYRPMLRKEDQPVARREGLPWTGPAPQIGQDRWLPPSAHHQVELNILNTERTLDADDAIKYLIDNVILMLFVKLEWFCFCLKNCHAGWQQLDRLAGEDPSPPASRLPAHADAGEVRQR